MSFWTNLRRFLCGWEKFEDLDSFVMAIPSVNALIDYSKQHFLYEKDYLPKDEWLDPHKAFIALQTKGTPSDCEEFSVVYDYWFKSKGYSSDLVAVWNNTQGHAICTFKDGDYFKYVDCWYRPQWRYKSLQQICFEVYRDAKKARIVRWDTKLKRYVYMDNINLKVG